MIEGKKVYICSPLSAKTRRGIIDNMMRARYYIKIISREYSCSAVAPHAYMPEFIDENDREERKLALDFGLSFLKLCDVLVICGDTISSGMKGEISRAYELGIPVYHFLRTDKGHCLVVINEKRLIYEM